MATGMRVMDGNRNASNGWQPELQAMDSNPELWAMDGNWNAGNGWQPELWAMDGNQNVSNGWQPEW